MSRHRWGFPKYEEIADGVVTRYVFLRRCARCGAVRRETTGAWRDSRSLAMPRCTDYSVDGLAYNAQPPRCDPARMAAPASAAESDVGQ